MVCPSPALGGWSVLGRLFALCICWAVFSLGSLPALAHADEPACFGSALEIPEEMPQPEREIRGLRNDLREACTAQREQLERAVTVLEGVNNDADEIRDAVKQLHDDLTPGGGVPVSIAGQTGAVEVFESGEGGGPAENVHVNNLGGVEEAVVSDSETVNQALWGIAGLFVGFLLLGVIYKVVRP